MKKSKTSTQMRSDTVLAIDPGFDRVGVAVLSGEKVLLSCCVVTDRKQSHAERLLTIGEAVKKIIKKWSPDSLAIEKLFFNQNVSTAIKVAEARGVIIYEAIMAGLVVYEYSPQEIKIAITSYGKASKTEVKNMLEKLVILPESNSARLDDEFDAIALGITHLATKKSI